MYRYYSKSIKIYITYIEQAYDDLLEEGVAIGHSNNKYNKKIQ